MSDREMEGRTPSLQDIKAKGEHAIEQVSNRAHELSDRLQASAHDLGDRLQTRAHDLGESSRRVGAQGLEYARRAGSSTGEFVAANALPLSLIGLGVGWLALSLRQQTQRSFEYDEFADPYAALAARDSHARSQGLIGTVQESAANLASRATDTTSEFASRVQQGVSQGIEVARNRVGDVASRATELASGARARAGELANQLGTQAADLSHEASERLQLARQRSVEYADENPLLVGALAVAAGVGVGLLLPATKKENSLLGEHRDRLLGDARGLLDEARDAAGQVTSQVKRQAKESAQELRGSIADNRFSH